MSIEVTVICDGCGMVMAGAKTAAEARRGAREGLIDGRTYPGGLDYCADCRARGHHKSRAVSP